MFDQRFLASKVGAAALVSVLAMIAFNVFAMSQFGPASPDMIVSASPMVELA